MFGLLEIENTAALPFWWRLAKKDGYTWESFSQYNFQKIVVEWPVNACEAERKRRLYNGYMYLGKQGISGIVLPKNFYDLPPQFGLTAANPVPLYRRLAGRMAQTLTKGGAKIVLFANRISPEVENCVSHIISLSKHIYLYVGDNTETFCFGLQKMTGAAVQKFCGQRGDLYIIFNAPTSAINAPQDATILNVSGQQPAVNGGRIISNITLTPPKHMARFWPDNCDTNAFLTALVSSGTVLLSEIGIIFEEDGKNNH